MAFNKIQLKTLAVEEATPGKNSPEDLIFYVEGSTGDVKKTQIKDLQISEQGDVYTVNGQTGSVVLDADDVGAVSKTGDKMTGKLALPGGTPFGALSLGDEGYVCTGTQGRMTFYASEDKDQTKNGWLFRTVLGKMGKRDALTINTDGELFVRGKNPVYHTGNKPSAADVGALPTSWRPGWNDVTGKPTVFTPATHTHPTSQITGLDHQLKLAGGVSGGPSNKDPNTDLSFHFLTNHSNSPNPSHYWHITQTFWGDVLASANRAQTAVQYNGGSSMYVRSMYSGTWTPWRKVFSTGDKPTWNDIEGKPSTFTPSSHRHTWREIEGKPAESTRWPTWGEVTGKPFTFPAQTHTHSWDELRGVAPVSKLPLGTTSTTVAAGNHNHDSSYSKLGHKHNWADINGVPVYATRWPNYGEVGLKAIDIPSISQYLGTADLNTIVAPGFYYQTANANTSAARNYPTTQAGSLLVQKSAGVTQMYTTYGPGANKVYVRSKYDNSWGSWIELYSTFNKPTLAELGAQPAGSYAAASHTHPWAQVTGAPVYTTRWPTWGEVSGKPSTMPPSAHTHDDRYLGVNGTAKNAINLAGVTTSITITGDANTYYPVVISGALRKEFPTFVSVWKNLGSTTNSSYSGNHTNKTSSLWLQYETRSTTWDGNGGYHKTLYKSEPYATLVAETNSLGNASGDLTVWLRGGGTQYYITVDNPSVGVKVYYTPTQMPYGVSVAPRTTIGNRGIYNTAPLGYGSITWNQVTGQPATATRWPTLAEIGAQPAGSYAAASHSHSYAPLTGAGTSGTWPISITGSSASTRGNAATATKLASISNTFSGKYPILVNANGVVYGHNSMQFEGATGTLSAPTFAGRLSGNATTASKWATGRTLTIGNKGKPVDGSANVTWSLAEIGAQPAGSYAASSHTHPWSQVTGAPATATRWPSWGEVSGKPTSFTPVAHSHSWRDLTGLPKYATRWPVWDEVIGKPNKPTKTKTTLYSGNIAYSGSTVYTLAKAWDQFDAIVVIGSHDGGNTPVSSIKTREELQEMYALAGTTKSWQLLAGAEIYFYWQMTDTSKTKFKITRENGVLYKIIGINYSL